MTSRWVAIDPGNEQSAYLSMHHTGAIARFGIAENEKLIGEILPSLWGDGDPYTMLVVEMIASYGMPVGREVFETCVWIGRFVQAWPGAHDLVYRRDVKLHLCGRARAKDGNIRAALIDRFGPGKDKAIGKKATPGPLYGVSADVWSALAVAVTYSDQQRANKRVA